MFLKEPEFCEPPKIVLISNRKRQLRTTSHHIWGEPDNGPENKTAIKKVNLKKQNRSLLEAHREGSIGVLIREFND